MLPHITPHYQGQHRIVEPFLGGAAVSFHLTSRHPGTEVFANDYLTPVIDIYTAVRNDVERFITNVETYATAYLPHDKPGRRAYYYQLRQQYMEGTLDGPEPLFFLLWCAYSGMYRTGKEYPGRFNTSHGFGEEKPGFYKPANLRAAAKLLTTWQLTSGDFADTLDTVDADTFVFLDPPYRETYTGYTGDGFDEADQLRVVKYFHDAASRGATVVYTNKDLGDDFYDTHFGAYHIDRVPIRYQVNRDCATQGRPESHEIIVSTHTPTATQAAPGI
jgi:DNA adenine methylase